VYNDAGPWKVHLHPESIYPFMRYCDSRERRKNAWDNYTQRASFKQPHNNNSLPIEDQRTYRQDLATSLGYATYADMVVQGRMAGSVNTVRDFVNT
jgi:Zn-dependent oligopeptidase